MNGVRHRMVRADLACDEPASGRHWSRLIDGLDAKLSTFVISDLGEIMGPKVVRSLDVVIATRWSSRVSFPPNLESYVTKFAPHKALNLIT